MSTDLIPVADLEKMAHAFAKSKLFGAKTPEEALSLMLIAQAEGMHPASAARDYHIIEGKASKKAEAMLRDFLKVGGRVEWHGLDDQHADATFSHPQGGTVRISWDMKRVEAAQIKNMGMYKKYPRPMLRSRVVSEGVRTVCPLATGGMYTPEEAVDPTEDVVIVEEVRRPQPKSGEPAAAPSTAAEAVEAEVVETGDAKLSDGQTRILTARLESAQVTDAQLKTKFGHTLATMPASKFNDVSAWVREMTEARNG